MNSKGVAILADPHPCGHIVYPYTDETQLAEAVCLFTGSGLRKGEAVVLVMTQAHYALIRGRLTTEGFDIPELERSGLLVCEGAENLLSTFLFDGILDEHEFKTRIGAIIERAKEAAGDQPVRIFGEMVSLIWETAPRATDRLEELWNQVIEAHSVPLLCAYALAGSKPDALPSTLVDRHSHALA